MESILRELHNEHFEESERNAPYTCLHILITSIGVDEQSIDLHMLYEGAYVVLNMGCYNPFEGHPFCHSCKEAQYRFLLGMHGNLIQSWSNAQFTMQDLHTANLYSDGRLLVRGVLQFPVNRINELAPRASATLVKNIEAHVWKRQHFPSTGGPRKLILEHAPFRRHILHATEAIQEAVTRLQPFIYLLVVDIYIKFLPDETDDLGRVRLGWAPITVNQEDHTNFGMITVQDDLTLEDLVLRFVRNPSISVYCLFSTGNTVTRSTWPGFARETFRDLYYQLQEGVGNGSFSYSLFPNGTLKYPLFQIHLNPEQRLPWKWVA